MPKYFILFVLIINLFPKLVLAQSQCPSPTGVSVSATNICLGSSINLSATIPAGTTTINWYTSATGGTPIATTNTSSVSYTPTATGTYTYYAEAVGAGGNQAFKHLHLLVPYSK